MLMDLILLLDLVFGLRIVCLQRIFAKDLLLDKSVKYDTKFSICMLYRKLEGEKN